MDIQRWLLKTLFFMKFLWGEGGNPKIDLDSSLTDLIFLILRGARVIFEAKLEPESF